MKFKRYPSLARAAEALKKRGFSEQFILENNCLIHQESDREYPPAEVAIVEFHRFFPKDHNPNRISIVFALETMDKIRGLLVATYNAYGKVNLLEFMDKVKIKSRQENAV